MKKKILHMGCGEGIENHSPAERFMFNEMIADNYSLSTHEGAV